MHEKLGAVLLEYQRLIGDPLDREHMKTLSAEQICSLFQWDHAVLHTLGGSTHPTNLTPLLISSHRTKTKKDVAAVAKGKRIRKRLSLYSARMPDGTLEPVQTYGWNRKIKWPSRPMGSKTHKRKLNGRTVRRDPT
jgi:hypothetical protein